MRKVETDSDDASPANDDAAGGVWIDVTDSCTAYVRQIFDAEQIQAQRISPFGDFEIKAPVTWI
jgi:hypothetical protein